MNSYEDIEYYSSGTHTDWSSIAVVLGIIGVIVLVVLIIGIACCCYFMRRKRLVRAGRVHSNISNLITPNNLPYQTLINDQILLHQQQQVHSNNSNVENCIPQPFAPRTTTTVTYD